MKIRNIVVLASVLLATLGHSQMATACRCAGIQSVKEALKESTAVFSGKVIEVNNKNGEFRAKIEIYQYWKGVTTKTVSMVSGMGNCSYFFTKGQDYLIYAYGNKELSTTICTPTKRLSEAKEDLAELGEGTEMSETKTGQPRKGD